MRFKWQARRSQLAGEPFAAVDIDLNRLRQPCLDSDVHQPEVPVDEVAFRRQTYGAPPGPGATVWPRDPHAPSASCTTDARENADQPLRDRIAPEDLSCAAVLGDRRGAQIFERSPRLLRQFLGMGPHACRGRAAKAAKSLHRTRWLARNRSMPLTKLIERNVPRTAVDRSR